MKKKSSTTNLTNAHESGLVRIGAIRGLLLSVLFALSSPAATVVNNGGGTGVVSATGAVVGWGVVSTNTTNPVVIVYYGQSDGGTNAAWWLSSTNLGAKSVGTNTVTLTNLTSGRMYYYRSGGYEGTNSTNWASSTLSFWTVAGVPTNLGAVNVRAVMVDTNGVLVAPTNFFGANSVGIVGQLNGQVPQWFEDTVASNSGHFVAFTDDVSGGLYTTVFNQDDFARSTNATVAGSLSVTGTGTFARVHGTNVQYSRAGNTWPRTWIAPGVYYTHTDGASGGALAAIGYSPQVFPDGLYTNVARVSVQLSFSTNMVFTRLYATNLTVRITACGPGGPSNPDGVYSSWAVARNFQPTNNASWTFANSGAIALVSTTNITLNVPVPTYDTVPSKMHAPMVYLLNDGAQPVSNVFLNFVIEYDNGTAD